MRAARTAIALLSAAVLAAGAVGCGGSDTSYEEVPGPPASVPIPSDSTALEAGAGADSDADADPDATPTETPTATPDGGTAAPDDQSGSTGTPDTAGAGTDTTGGATDDTDTADSGGSTAPDQADSPTTDATPEPGSDAQQFEDFCSQNPGAC